MKTDIRILVNNLVVDFNHDNLKYLIREKTNKFPIIDNSLQIDFRNENFRSINHLGNIELEDQSEIIVCTIETKSMLSEKSGKKTQYEIAKKVLKQELRYKAGFFIFHDEKKDFRLSLVYDIPEGGGKRSWSNFRRYTYYVSKDQTNNTFINQFSEAHFTSFEKIIDAFSVEKVTKAFYDELHSWFLWANDNVVFPDGKGDNINNNSMNLIRLITRLIFVWFMKQKKMIPSQLFEPDFLDNYIKFEDKTASTYYKAVLQNLFFATLNTKMKKDDSKSRIFVDDAKKFGYINDSHLQQGYYRYARFIKDKDEFIKLFENIPFFNGGLFESLDKSHEQRIDCFSDNLINETKLKVPDFLFFKKNANSTVSNKNPKERGLLDILKSYNFTIDENTPIDEEIALDPELLGKVFERLLANYNPETRTSLRKQTGSFYTPREIVNYMVDESLLEYIKQNCLNRILELNGIDKINENSNISIPNNPVQPENLSNLVLYNLRALFSYAETTNPFDKTSTKILIETINKCKILDPACGSGAFPMGILHKMVHILQKLDPENNYWKELQRKKAIEETETAYHIGNKEERTKRLGEINDVFENNASDYGRKLYLIENCIYGIDIQTIAVQIAKLRFFLSLVIEQKSDMSKENLGIRPLPNLETKFVAANTLIGLDMQLQSQIPYPKIDEKEKELKELRHKYFIANSRKEKSGLQKQDKILRAEIAKLLEHIGWDSKVATQIVEFDPYDQNESTPWFDPEWMFGIKDGFDIVIGNPPYVQLQKEGGRLAKQFEKMNYQTFTKTGDIYTLFYEKGINLLNSGGLLTFITSNKWMRAGYGEKLREFFSKKDPLFLIDLGPGAFESATVDTNILLIKNNNNSNNLRAVTISSNSDDNIDINSILKNDGVIINKLTKDAWTISGDLEMKIKEKIEGIGTPLKDWDISINYGIKTGFNDAFIIDGKKKDELIAADPKSAEIIKPILRGRDIKRYKAEFADKWLIFTAPALKINIDNYPAIRDYLKSFGERIHQTGENGCRKKTYNKWFELQDTIAFYEDFEKEKIVWKRVGSVIRFQFDNCQSLCLDSTCLLTSNNVDLKYLLAIMNSRISIKFLLENSPKTGTGDVITSVQAITPLRIPQISPKAQQPFIDLVNQILAKKAKGEDSTPEEREIDQLVYKLYDLTAEEIQIVEGKN
jgi:hypothetical protein